MHAGAEAAVMVKNYISDTGPMLVGIAALALSLVSLAWQAWTHFAVGSRPQLLLSLANFHNFGTTTLTQPYELVAMTPTVWTGDAGAPQQVLMATVRNTGRAPTTVTSLTLTMGDPVTIGNMTLSPPGQGSDMARKPFPCRLEGESEEHWLFPLDNLKYVNHNAAAVGADPLTRIKLIVRARVAKRRTGLKATITVPVPLTIHKLQDAAPTPAS